jgi:RNA polymerase sigma-70 factor (ECF subfamily)
MNHSETDLLAQIAGGNHEAFERFYRRHLDHVVGYAAKRCRDPHEVAEVTAAVFVAVWSKAHTFDASRGTEMAWLNGISARALIDIRRGEARLRALRQRIADQHVMHVDDEGRLAARIDAEQRAGSLAAAVAGLPAAQRDVVTLVVLDAMTSSEAADVLNMSAVAVRMRLSRAKKSLREFLEGDSALPTELLTAEVQP